MDDHALRVLEFPKVAALLSRYTVTARGRRLALGLRPLRAPERVGRALRLVAEMMQALRDGFTLPLGALEDVSAAARRAMAGAVLEPVTLWRVGQCLETAERVGRALSRLAASHPALASLGQQMPRCPELLSAIRSSVDASGAVLDSASEALAAVRSRIRALRRRIESTLGAMVEDPDVRPYLQYPNPTIRGDRYVLPVNAYHRHQVPGIVHGSSDSGATLYVEPMQVVEPGNELCEALGEEEEEVRRVLTDLSRQVGAECETVEGAIEALGQVDLVRAKALTGLAFGMVVPRLGGDRRLVLRGARHPLLLWLTCPDPQAAPAPGQVRFETVVPLDLELGGQFDLMVLTGPNTGGKTVVLKTVGLICLMARAGMPVPAEQAVVPLYDGVYADIGDEQSLEQSLSTFSSHMEQIIRILNEATPRSLVLLDELGAGTDPTEGAALGEAVLGRLAGIGCSAIVVTHLGPLKTFALKHPRVENASVEFDPETLRPTYRLRVGAAGSSNALAIAERLGLPADVLAQARALLDQRSGGRYSAVVEEIDLNRREAEQHRLRMESLEARAERLKAHYERAIARLRDEQQRRGAEFGLKLRDALRQLHAEAERLCERLRHTHSGLFRTGRTVRDGLARCLEQIEELLAGRHPGRELKPGDQVYVLPLHRWGTVERVERQGRRLKVRVGQAQVELSPEEVEPWGARLQGQ